MGKIKKLLENELIGGSQNNEIYPVTSTKAVFNKNNESLDYILLDTDKKLSSISGNYNGLYQSSTVIFTKDTVKAGMVINVSFTIIERAGTGDIIVTGSGGEVLHRFEVTEAEVGYIYPTEKYTLPVNYESVKVGAYGRIKVDISVQGLNSQELYDNIKDCEDKIQEFSNNSDGKIQGLGVKTGGFSGEYLSSDLFSNKEVPSGVQVTFKVTPYFSSYNILVRDNSDSVIERFESLDAEIGREYTYEYTLPDNYKKVAVGGYGKVKLDVTLESKNIYQLSTITEENSLKIQENDTKIKYLEDNTKVGEESAEESISPSETINNKMIYVDSGTPRIAESTLQNIAEYDVENCSQITITARISSNKILGYYFELNDGTFVVGSKYENGAILTEHILEVPNNSKKLAFSYFIEDGISAKAIKMNNTPINTFAKDILKKAEIALSLAGAGTIFKTTDELSNGLLEIKDAPKYTKKDCVLSLSAKIGAFNSIEYGLGYKTSRGLQVKVDSTNITYTTINNQRFQEPHGLTISDFLRCSVYHQLKKYVFIISTLSGNYYKEFNEDELNYAETYGTPYIYADDTTNLTDVKLSRGGSDFKKPIWIFADSYSSFDVKRWTYHIIQYGFDNFMLCGLAGATSKVMYEQLLLCLKFGTPKYIVWCLGMNDGTEKLPYRTYYELVKALCENKGIELILQTIPNIPTADKSTINNIVKTSGLRYIDVADAVGSYDNHNWYDGYLDDGTHPTELGAKAITSQILSDFPEIMQ